jgi:hypothetical protein
MTTQYAELPTFHIVAQFDPDKPGSGTITCTPDLYETCPKCGQKDCLYQCDESQMDPVEPDAILSVILAHASAGIDVKTPAYLEGIETAFDAVSNQ